jgi:hypothetical protein
MRADGYLLECNDALLRLAHLRTPPARLDEVLPDDVVGHLHSDTPDEPRRHRHAVNGSPVCWVAWSSKPWPLDPALRLVTGIDVTREHALEDYIAANQWFETAAALSGGLAHDFNNALAGILGLSEIISLRLPEDSPLHGFTSRIAASVDRAKTIVRRFSQFSRKSTGVADAQPTAMLVDELVPLLKAFMPSAVVVTSAVDPETPWCRAERHEFEHILLNCCTFFRARLRQEGGTLHLAALPAPERAGAVVRLTASGQGLLGAPIERAFELDLARSETAYDSGAAVHTAARIARAGQASLQLLRDDPRTLSFVLRLPPAL